MRLFTLCLLVCISSPPALGQTPASAGGQDGMALENAKRLEAFGVQITDEVQRTAFYAAIKHVLASQQKTCRSESIHPMSKAALTEVENSIRMAQDDTGRVFALELAIQANHFTVRQLEELIRQVNASEEQKANLLIRAYPRITDARNFHRLAHVFTRPKTRDRMLKTILKMHAPRRKEDLKTQHRGTQAPRTENSNIAP